jgi:chemotaxis signal transduction protein
MPGDKRDVARDLRLMPCQAGGRSYYLDASAVRSVHRKEEWRLNWRSDSPLGWIRHRGEEIPILDLARALGVAHTTVSDSAVVVDTESGPKAWGVGSVGRVVALPEERILPVPAPCWTESSPPWMGVVTGEGTQALCVSPQHLGQSGTEVPRMLKHAPPGPAQQATGRAILFSAGLPNVRFCLGFGQVAEVITSPRLVAVPAGRPWLLGLIVWRGRSVPVIDLNWGVTGKGGAADTEDYLIVRATAHGDLAAVTLFGKPEAVDLPFDCEREDEPRVTSREWFRAAFKRDHELFLTPDFAAILAAERI